MIVVSILDQPWLKDLSPVAKLSLEKTPPPNYTFPWESGNKISYAMLIVVILLISVCIISGILLFRKCANILNKIKKAFLSVGPDVDEQDIADELK